MNGASRQRLNRIAGRKDDSFHGSVVRQHGDEHFGIGRSFAGRFRKPRTQGRERFSTASRPIVNR